MLKLGSIGGLGLMASPAAKHLSGESPAKIIRVHDRGTRDSRRDGARADWQRHGASLVPSFEQLVGPGDLDAVIVCAGKNGDDLTVIADLARKLGKASSGARPTVIHMSTVSSGFARAAAAFCSSVGVDYVNYPLTGGPKGAELGGAHPNGMLILAAGPKALFERFEPTLRRLGHPRYFGEAVDAGAVVKLVGQHMVFNGCVGISSAAGIVAASFYNGELTGPEQTDFFQFLNNGAGGTRQWDVGLSKGVRDAVWDQGFMVKHAVVDAIYAAQLALDLKLSRLAIEPMVNIALAFSFLLEQFPSENLATHAIAREITGRRDQLDAFLERHRKPGSAPHQLIADCIESLPENVRRTVLLDISEKNF